MTQRAWVVGWVAVSLLLNSCAGGRPSPTSNPPPVAHPFATPGVPAVLTVMTYNVNFGLAGDAATIAAIRDAGTDVVFLQETTPAWEEALRRTLGDAYRHMVFHHCCGAGGLAVLSRFPFDEQELIPAVPSGWFPALRVVVHTGLGDVQALVVHLHPPLSESGSVVRGYFASRRVRRAEIEAFYGHLEQDALPTLIAGDFNEDASGRALTFLEDHGLASVLARLHGNVRTWRWETSAGTVTQQLDHIVYDARRLEALDARVIEAGRSDHYPVVASFILPVPRASGASL